jgi:hypothetical protein
MFKTTTLFGILFIAVLSSKAQTPCSADKPSNRNPKMCIYDQIKPITITRGAASNSSHLYNYWIFSPYDPGTPPTVNPIAKVSSASSQFDPAPFLPTPLNATNYQFWIAEYDSTEKCLGRAAQLLLNINQTIAPTAIANDKFCQKSKTIEPLSVTDILPGATVNWYPSNVSTTADSSHLGSLSTPNPYNVLGVDALVGGTYTYLASQTVGGCQSIKIPVSFSIIPQPAPPILTANSSCEGLAFTALTATGTEAAIGGTYQWYENPVLTSLLGGKSSNSYTPTTTTIPKAGVITFYATQTSAVGCISDAASVNYTVYPHPQAPIFANATQSMCATSNSVPIFTVTNVDSSGTIEWNANNSVTGATYTPVKLSIENTVITSVQKENGCVSDTSQATLIVIPQPAKPSVSGDKTICVTNKPIAFTAQATGTNELKWYTSKSDIGSANIIKNGTSYLPTSYTIPAKDGDPDAISSYFVTQSTSDTNHCEGLSEQVNLIVKAKPIAPNFIDVNHQYIIACADNLTTIDPLIVEQWSNGTFRWFNLKTQTLVTPADGTVTTNQNSGLFTPVLATLKPESTNQFYVNLTNSVGCVSDSVVGTYRIARSISMNPILLSSTDPVCMKNDLKLEYFVFAKGDLFTWYINDSVIKGADSSTLIFKPTEKGNYRFRCEQSIKFVDPHLANSLTCPGPPIAFTQKINQVPIVKVSGDTIIYENTSKIVYTITPEDISHTFQWWVSGNQVLYAVSESDLYRQIDWLVPGFDTIRVSEDNGACKGYDSLVIEVKAGTFSSIVRTKPLTLNISPNPASQLLTIKYTSEYTGIGTIKLFNITGSLVYKKRVSSVASINETISVVSLPEGIYTVVLETTHDAVSALISIIK